MPGPALTVDQNILPVQAYFNLDGTFNTFIGQGQPFVITATESIGIVNTNVNATLYPTFTSATSGQVTGLAIASPSLTWNPGTGVFSAPTFFGTLNGTANTANNLSGGGAGQIVYQNALNSTAYLAAGSTGQFLLSNGTSAPSWSTVATSVTISDQTTDTSTYYPLFYSATSGSTNIVETSSTKLQYQPSTGKFTATLFSGSGASLTNIPNSALTNNSVTIGSTSIALGGITGTIAGLVSLNATTVTGTNLVGSLASSTGLPLTTGVTGILPIANGGTNSSATPTAGGVGYGTGTAYAFSTVGTAGNFLQSNGAGAPVWSAISTSASTIGISTNSTNATYYPTYFTAQTGTATTEYTNPNYTFNPSTGALSVTSFIENGYNIVSQKDVGTGANQIPLNQYLGTMAYQDAKAVQIGGGSTTNLVGTSGYQIQPTITALTATTTLTIAQLLTYIVQVTSATAVALTLPTGTLTDAGVLNGLSVVNNSFLWIVINTGSASGAITMTAGTGHTYVGNATVAINTSAQFQTVKTATNTFVTYRIA